MGGFLLSITLDKFDLRTEKCINNTLSRDEYDVNDKSFPAFLWPLIQGFHPQTNQLLADVKTVLLSSEITMFSSYYRDDVYIYLYHVMYRIV